MQILGVKKFSMSGALIYWAKLAFFKLFESMNRL